MLYECLTRDKPEMLQTYLCIHQLSEHLHLQDDSLAVWNLKLVLGYYSGTYASRLSADWTKEPLLQPEFLASSELRLSSALRAIPALKLALNAYVRSGVVPGSAQMAQFQASASSADKAAKQYSGSTVCMLFVSSW